jgi:hypothetical protein
MDYTTLDSMKARLGLPATENPTEGDARDALIQSLITSASDWIDAYCGRKFGLDTYTEFLKGNGTQKIVLSQGPVWSITSLYFDPKGYWGYAPGSFGPDKLLAEGVDYALSRDQPDGSSVSRIVYRINGLWCQHKAKVNPFGGQSLIAAVPQAPTGNIEVTYTAGYETIPGAVKLATETAVARLWQSGNFGSVFTGESYEDYSYTLAAKNPDDILGPVKPLLAQYKNVVV